MFTTGSKLYFGLAALATAVFALLGVTTSWTFPASLAVATLAVAFAFLGGLVSYARDVTALVATAQEEEVPRPPVSGSVWPLVAGFGAAFTAMGVAVDTRLFLLGLAIVLAATLEWVTQAWADRASADPRFNARVRGRLLQPLEWPFLGTIVLLLVVFGFSRIMLAIPEEMAATVAFVAVAVMVLVVGFVLASRPELSRPALSALVIVGALLALGGGIAGVAAGEKDSFAEEREELAVPRTSCGERREEGKETSNAVSSKAGVPRITFDEEGFSPDDITVPRALWISVIFRNQSGEQAKFVIDAEERPVVDEAGNTVSGPDGEPVTEQVQYCTDFVQDGTSQLVTFQIALPGVYRFVAETGAEEDVAAEGRIVVS
jgi:hypothetical protein